MVEIEHGVSHTPAWCSIAPNEKFTDAATFGEHHRKQICVYC